MEAHRSKDLYVRWMSSNQTKFLVFASSHLLAFRSGFVALEMPGLGVI